MLHHSPLLTLLLATAATAQVPYEFLVVGERASGSAPAIHYVDPANGAIYVLEGYAAADTMKDCLTVCVDPSDPTTFYAGGATSGFLGGDVFPIVATGNRHAQIAKYRPAGMPGFAFPKQFRRAGASSLMMTVSGGSNNGLYEIDLNAQSVQRLAITIPNFADDIAVIGNKVYANSDSAQSTIVEWDLVLGSGRTVGSTYPNLRSLAVRNGQLLAGTATGDIVQIDPASGTSQPFFQAPVGGPIVAIATRGGASDPVYYAIQGAGTWDVHSTASPSTPIYSTTNTISDLDVGVHDQPSFLWFGTGCQSSLGVPLTFEHVNDPALGAASFTLRVAGVPTSAPALCLLGFARLTPPVDLAVIGAPGCTLYVDGLAALPAFGSGTNHADVSLVVPSTPALVGGQLLSQWVVVDSTANPIGAVTSDATVSIIR